MAADCHLVVDDYAVYRHPELGIEVARKLLPDLPHVAVFDTAFFHDLPAASADLRGVRLALHARPPARRADGIVGRCLRGLFSLPKTTSPDTSQGDHRMTKTTDPTEERTAPGALSCPTPLATHDEIHALVHVVHDDAELVGPVAEPVADEQVAALP